MYEVVIVKCNYKKFVWNLVFQIIIQILTILLFFHNFSSQKSITLIQDVNPNCTRIYNSSFFISKLSKGPRIFIIIVSISPSLRIEEGISRRQTMNFPPIDFLREIRSLGRIFDATEQPSVDVHGWISSSHGRRKVPRNSGGAGCTLGKGSCLLETAEEK